ncbi:MAG TPA: hypothetical protein VF645_03395 [Allosphingosinicella sp.]|jgi:uncharacterized membrane protein
MRILGLIAATSTLVGACGSRESGGDTAPANESRAPAGEAGAPGAAAGPAESAGKSTPGEWDLQSSGEGVALVLAAGDRPAIRLFCPAGGKRLVVNVPGFRPIGSEERLSFGSGGEAAALVADSAGDRQRGGVTGAGEVPGSLAAMVAGPVSASYGTQRSGPHPAPPSALSSAFVAACGEGSAQPAKAPEPSPGPVSSASPCNVQDGKPVRAAAVRALGTEPFWNARVEGRCVTYSNPEDQKGTRVWTRFTPGPGGGTWSGTLGGGRFELRIRPKRGCSDGMSDKSYPLAAELVVGGERRQGCAEPL